MRDVEVLSSKWNVLHKSPLLLQDSGLSAKEEAERL